LVAAILHKALTDLLLGIIKWECSSFNREKRKGFSCHQLQTMKAQTAVFFSYQTGNINIILLSASTQD
jgi:hypothetical protein